MEMNLRPVIDYERDGWKESMPLRMKNVVSISDRSEARFTSNGVGFTANLDPDPFYDSRAGRDRQYIRIHPARSNGTNGCIGLRANKAQLIRARDLIRKSLKKGLTIKLYVRIGGN